MPERQTHCKRTRREASALKFFEREWMVNLILWGNMHKLTASVIDEMQLAPRSRVLQVACVYGDFSNKLSTHLSGSGSTLEIVDVADIQIRNAREKLAQRDNVRFHHQDSTAMALPRPSRRPSGSPARAARSFSWTTTARNAAIRCVT